MSELANAFQKSVYQQLVQDAELILLLGEEKVFDCHIVQEDYPYITIANWQSVDWSTDTDQGEEIVIEIDVWDDQTSQKQMKNISSRVKYLLHDQALSLEVGNLVNLRFENVFFQSKGRSKLQAAKLKFRAKIEV